MSRSNKGIRDIVKDTRVGSSEVRPPSSSGSQPLGGLPYVMNSSKMQKQYSGLSQSKCPLLITTSSRHDRRRH